ncbi:hypothetical protein LTR48_003209 [Friedmanniomyces endolithicus]|uniref:F-box domain-containing protein n=1 Tax=Rachicladosporium monterosium TaxID=1507873 RepID=A0ABR0L0E8_9PEZI|nr:hypothetical protein LTR48_003209 [Friedmanniomyces endolithicus]KAK5141547.1 hypothetical protein LTR32_005914 [Rachicladosporium monterosium]
MPSLQTLPVELLILISEHLGGRELRRGKNSGTRRLTLFRNWYDAARSVFASGMDLATVRVYSYNAKHLSRGQWSYASGQRRLMHKNTRTLSLGFVGNWYDEEESLLHIEFMNGEEATVAAGSHEWQSRTLAPILDELCGDLGNFTALESLSVEAMKEEPRYNKFQTQVHLFPQTLQILLRSLPIAHNLTILTVDTTGTNITADAEIQPQHEPICLCPSLAAILPLIPTIRLRLPRICSALFPRLPTTTNSPLPPEHTVKARSLILKLYLPTFHPENATSCSDNRPITLTTSRSRPANHPWDNGDDILAAARGYLAYLSHLRHGPAAPPAPDQQFALEANPAANPCAATSGLQLFRITLADPDPAGPALLAFDVLAAERAVWEPGGGFGYEDDGGMQDWDEGAV